MPSFQDFSLQPATQAALNFMQITEPTPIQAQAIPALLSGKDLVGQSATGSGKTLAYGIPLVERLTKDRRAVQALVLVPTRELAVQVNTVLAKLASGRRLATALLVGGRSYGPQISSLRYGSQIVVGTPGRIKDHLERGTLRLDQVRMCVLDEADQMLDIGFAPVIEEILATTPETRQMALFSATMPDWVAKLQEKYLKEPVRVAIGIAEGGESTIEQIAYQVPHNKKMEALCTLLLSAQGESSLIFGKTKFGVEKLGKQLDKMGFTVATLHGNKSQRAREDVLTAFRKGQVQTLLATNVAARGLDIKGIYQVINYELPESSELFTHRIGRTGRMGQQGKAITLLVPSELSKWRRMSQTLGQTVKLHKLAINEEAMTTPPTGRKPAVVEEPEQFVERPMRERRPAPARTERYYENEERSERSFARGAERPQRRAEAPAWQERDRSPRNERPRPETGARRRERFTDEQSSWQSAELEEADFRSIEEVRASRPDFPRREQGQASGGSSRKRQQAREAVWQADEFNQQPERSYREGMPPAKKMPAKYPSDYERSSSKPKERAVATAERPLRKKAGVSPSIRARRSATSNRSGRR